MKQVKYLVLSLLLLTIACQEDTEYIDGMITALTNEGSVEYASTQGLKWNSALSALHVNRQRMSNLMLRVERGAYTDEGYDIEDPNTLISELEELIKQVDFSIDSIWSIEIKDSFDMINPQNQGILSLGKVQFEAANDQFTTIYNWLKSDYDTDTNNYVTKDFELLQEDISVLNMLSDLNDEEVLNYVEDVKDRLISVEEAYPTIEQQINTSEFISSAQRELYASLSADVMQMKEDVNGNITLATSDVLSEIETDLMSLVYFFDNNNTSPAVEPRVYGQISNICELRWFSEEATTDDYAIDWLLTADIDAAETHRWNLDEDEKGFQQIFEFTGNFDGGYHIISGLLLTGYGPVQQSRPGMFHYFLGGTLQNFGLANVFVNSTSSETGQGGTLIAYLKGVDDRVGTVERCFVHGVKELGKQDGGFIGRIRETTLIRDCFSAVDCNFNGAAGAAGSSCSFFATVITGPHNLQNLINLGESQNNVFTGGHASSNIGEALGLYFDSSVVGKTRIESGAYASTTVTLSDDGVVNDLATDLWSDLSNFTTLNSEIWEVKTVPTFDENPRPYLLGFDYQVLDRFIVPDFSVYN